VPRAPSQAEPVWAAELAAPAAAAAEVEALAAVVEEDAWGAALAGARVVWVRMAVVMAEAAGALAKAARAAVMAGAAGAVAKVAARTKHR